MEKFWICLTVIILNTYLLNAQVTSCDPQKNPCLNNGICEEDDSGNYQCHCDALHIGVHCETKISTNKCTPNPCSNNATCRTAANERIYECGCLPGFKGQNCEMNINECSSNPCQNGGSCQDGINIYTCICDHTGYKGKHCEENINECDNTPNPCLNNGICYDTVGGYTCQCAAGYEGRNCELNSNECTSSPCKNGGYCRDLVGSYECHCLVEFAGRHCELTTNECDPVEDTCPPNSHCIPNEKGYNHCACKVGFNGYPPNCTENICDTVPCQNGGQCTANGDLFNCTCLPGFAGSKCEVNIDDCAKVTCPIGKVCIDMRNAYECRCQDGFSGENCSTASCTTKPCQNNGTCIQGANNFTCTCPPGFTGVTCDTDVDECAVLKDVCNYGICVNSPGSYQCFCQPGFAGDHCDVDFDECLSNPCFNGATCLNKINKYYCVCPPGFSGKDCSVNINECDSSPCQNGATCVDEVAAFSCVCSQGLTGRLCEININDCESNPCLNAGLCIDLLNNYTCNCDNTGFTGNHCEHNIDDCISNPCVNGARCIDKVKDYQCDCYAGYTGKNCEENIRECDSNPCQFGGTCIERSNVSLYKSNDPNLPKIFSLPFNYSSADGYDCLCVPGIMGPNCEININECESNPCRWGACVDKIGGYVCECEDGFEGVHCETDINECDRYNPCKHGSCVDKRAGYFCDCLPKYGGKNCSVELIGCNASDTCLNGGTCKPYLVDETQHKFNCSCPYGFHGKICEKITTMSFNGQSHIMLNTSREEGYDISFRFKTTLPSGLLAIGKGSTYYILELVNGRLNLHSSLLNKWEGVFIGSRLNDSQWQKLFVAINSSHLVLAANEEQTIYPINPTYDQPTASQTSFPTTFVGGAISSLVHLAHAGSSFVGCIENVVINGEWVLPEDQNVPNSLYHNITVGCPREEQCSPNPCHSAGHCTDLWRDFSCSCERPFLGHTCQYNFTAATFGHENITNSMVTVTVGSVARRAVRNIVDISMFIRTRQQRGAIFYLGSQPGSADETYIVAEMESGELFVRLQFNCTPESYNVGGVKLADGNNHLIQVVRNVSLVQVKLNGTEYFRKTISNTGQLDVQVLYLGGIPESVHHHRSIRSYTTVGTTEQSLWAYAKHGTRVVRQTSEKLVGPLPNFKGIIHDVQISNGSRTMVVEFFPLQVEDLTIPPSFGVATFDADTITEGVVSDNACASDPCEYGGTCIVTWNDFNCVCTRGHKGKTCHEKEFCQLKDCPAQSECRNLNDGYECVSNKTFTSNTSSLEYSFTQGISDASSSTALPLDKILLSYRTRRGGSLFYMSGFPDPKNYFSISLSNQHIYVSWQLSENERPQVKKMRKDPPMDEWTHLSFTIKDNTLQGGLADSGEDSADKFISASNFSYSAWAKLVTSSRIYLGGNDFNPAMFDSASYVTDGEGSNSIDFTVSATDITLPSSPAFTEQTSGVGYFKGCMGEVRIGELLLPYFTKDQLGYSEISSYDTFSLKSSPEVEDMIDIGCILCTDEECRNGASCMDPLSSYGCKCLPGYSGEDCSIDINECDNNSCQNGASCVDDIAKYACTCLAGWEGSFCEKEIDECLSNPCQNNGECIDRIGFFECKCTEEYIGKFCENIRQISCADEPCRFGATCVDGKNILTGDNFTCNCAHGFEGVRCDTPYCNVKPFCLHDGICNISGPAGPLCECTSGYTGQRCEINIDDCASAPCNHGTQCIDGVNTFTCNCTDTGFTGLTCDDDINECDGETNMCGGNGECINEIGSYRCNCQSDTCGYNCDFPDPCKESPCQNGGTCREICRHSSEYKCDCLPGWAGKNCTEVPEYLSNKVADIAIILGPILAIILAAAAISLTVFFMMARKKRATRGTYSPSSQEYCNPRVEMDNVLKPPPEERLI